MPFALIKLSYNEIGDSNIEGGICGTGFFVDNKIFITAHHIFNNKSKIPNVGFRNCQYWLVSKTGEIIEVKDVNIADYPEIDTTTITFNTCITDNIVEIERTLPNVGDEIYNQGFTTNMPMINCGYNSYGLFLKSVDLSNNISDGNGTVREINNETIYYDDVKLKGKTLIITSYPGRVGMSGGPMYNVKNEVIGLMSIGFPPDIQQKNFLGAIWIDEILKITKCSV